MSQRERSSLTAALAKRPLAKAAERAPTAVAESLLLGDSPATLTRSSGQPAVPAIQPTSQPTVVPTSQPTVEPMEQRYDQPTIQPVILPPSLLRRKEKRRPRVAWTFKIPPELHEELAAVAEHNDLPMAEIVIEAITLHLKNFPHPEMAQDRPRQ
jgi:predicted DNA-binding protein